MRCSPFILTLVCFLDLLVTFITLGDQFSLECVSDYLSAVTCSLNISDECLSNDSSCWLHFSADDESYNCTLEMAEQALLCELDLSPHVIFSDVDDFRISLHSGCHGNNFSILLLDDFMPSKHIRPVPPGNLTVFWEENGTLFQWQSGYEHFSLLRSSFISSLQYQLSLCSKYKLYEVETVGQKVYVDEFRFEPHTNYTVRVRSRPDQEHYEGLWSPWSPALRWRSRDARKDTTEGSSNLTWYCLVPSLLVLLSCITYSRWRKDDYIPSPAPYFRDWDVDVQMCSGKVRDVMQEEESLQFDMLTASVDTPPQTALHYDKMGTSDGQEATPQSPSMPHSPVGSEVDSGCWVRDFVATEKGSITCSEDYCTLSNSHTLAPPEPNV